MSDFAKLPHTPSIPVKPFKAHCSDEILSDLRRRLGDSLPPTKTFENTTNPKFGITHDWLVDAIEQWKTFDWREVEQESNAIPNFTAHLSHNGHEYDLHFAALFSEKKDAIPVLMTHGWPGCFLEFIPMLKLLSTKYTPSTLPIHLIVPSLIGFGYSSLPPVEYDFATRDNAFIIDKLMDGLGLHGYVAQGGDIGSFVARFIAQSSTICAAVHLDMIPAAQPKGFDISSLDKVDQECADKLVEWQAWERAYVNEHATKTATIAAVVESSPIALLSWVGEKWIGWTDDTPSTHTILSMVTMYWITKTFATSIYHYRVSYGKDQKDENKIPPVTAKPLGYSQFAHEIMPTPLAFVKQENNVVWHRRHERGGHFSALENAELLWDDVSDFIEKVAKH